MKDNITLTKNDYKTLVLLANDNCNSELQSYTLKTISEKTHLSINTIRKSVTAFLELGYLQEGVQSWRAKSYFITTQGLDKVKSILN